MRRLALIGLTVLLASCTPAEPRPAVGGSLEPVRGDVFVASGTSSRKVSGRVEVRVGDRVTTGEDGVGRLSFGTATAELVPGSRVDVLAGRPFLRTGAILTSGAMRVQATGASIRTTGDVRVDRTLTLRAAVYEGSATLSRDGATVDVARFREASAAPGFFARVSRPMRADGRDAWDRRFLADELELERNLESVRVGLSGRPAAIPVAIAELAPAPLPAISGLLTQEEVLFAAAIAAASPGRFVDRVREAGDLRAEGASWAIVAATLDANAEKALSLVTDAVRVATSASPSPSPTPVPQGRPTPTPPPSPGASPTPRPPDRPTPTPPPSPTPTPVCLLGLICIG